MLKNKISYEDVTKDLENKINYETGKTFAYENMLDILEHTIMNEQDKKHLIKIVSMLFSYSKVQQNVYYDELNKML